MGCQVILLSNTALFAAPYAMTATALLSAGCAQLQQHAVNESGQAQTLPCYTLRDCTSKTQFAASRAMACLQNACLPARICGVTTWLSKGEQNIPTWCKGVHLSVVLCIDGKHAHPKLMPQAALFFTLPPAKVCVFLLLV